MSCFRFLLPLLLVSLVGCAQRTQVVVIVEADEAIQNDASLHHAHLYLRAANPGELDDAEFTRDEPVGEAWPLRFVLTPSGEGAFSYTERNYEIIVSAHRQPMDGELETINTPSIVSTRVRSGYVRGQTRVLVMRLEVACRDRAPCAGDERCSGGDCVPIFRQPDLLPNLTAYQTDAGPDAPLAPIDAPGPDVYVPPGVDADIDASFDTSFDAGVDAFVEPGTDAFMEPDAHVPPDAFVPMGFRTITALPESGALFNTGSTVSTSDSTTIAVGAPGAADYLYDATRPLMPPRQLNYATVAICGQGAAINAAGDVAAFGCPASSQFVVWRGPAWDVPVFGGADGVAGHTVAMNAAGTMLAIVGPSAITLARGATWETEETSFPGVSFRAADLSDSGSVLVVGLFNPGTGSGEVRTFAVTASTLTFQPPALSMSTDEGFGGAVALSGDGSTLVVGTTGSDGRSVYVYRRSAGSWTLSYMRSSAVSLGRYGASVAVNGDGTRIAVGASAEGAACLGLACAPDATSTATGTGAVYVYDGDGNLLNYIRPIDSTGVDFGFSVALNRAGTRLVIGEPTRTGGGAVYIVE